MAVLEVLIYGHPLLRKKISEVIFPDEKISVLASNMIDTMNIHEGVGLAAPQVGADRRLIVIDAGRLRDDPIPHPMVLINPKIVSFEGQVVYREGCLSIPDIYADVKRPGTIAVQFQDLHGQLQLSHFSDFEARIIQHEIDHLNGILFIDHLHPVRRWFLRSKLNDLKSSGIVFNEYSDKGLTA